MAIDRGDSHFDDAGTYERACRHIALFLWWAAERGLASDLHNAKTVARAPTQHFISECDTKLCDEDFSDEGNAFAKAAYSAYLDEVSAYAGRLGIGDCDVPEDAETARHFFDWLDHRLRAWRAK